MISRMTSRTPSARGRTSVAAQRGMIVVVTLWAALAAPPSYAEPEADLEFLEFLGSWETREGDSVDPFEVESLMTTGTNPDHDRAYNADDGAEHRSIPDLSQGGHGAGEQDSEGESQGTQDE